ncbi:MAG: PPOX class F420-dependent oxidoreductase [Acidimicrobiia bacterium]|nr:PPOX class F420-dependent oxidoreductase [Acidimicrobiia bacterium]
MTVPPGLASTKYVSLTTYKRDGTPVASPVWITGDGGHLAVVTESDAWKVKRLRHDPRVLLAVSDPRGRVKDSAERYEGTAEVVSGPDADRLGNLITKKYGLLGRIMPVFYVLRNRVRRRPPPEAVALVITINPSGS